jgi:hypothetical protein
VIGRPVPRLTVTWGDEDAGAIRVPVTPDNVCGYVEALASAMAPDRLAGSTWHVAQPPARGGRR